MTEPSAPVAPASPGPHLQPLTPFARRSLYGVIGVIALALVFGGWGLWQVLGNTQANQPTPAQMQALQKQIDVLEQRSATLSRSDQISREANRDLQGALAERDEEVAGLRADVAFYERFVGATAQRRGLSLHVAAEEPAKWRLLRLDEHMCGLGGDRFELPLLPVTVVLIRRLRHEEVSGKREAARHLDGHVHRRDAEVISNGSRPGAPLRRVVHWGDEEPSGCARDLRRRGAWRW